MEPGDTGYTHSVELDRGSVAAPGPAGGIWSSCRRAASTISLRRWRGGPDGPPLVPHWRLKRQPSGEHWGYRWPGGPDVRGHHHPRGGDQPQPPAHSIGRGRCAIWCWPTRCPGPGPLSIPAFGREIRVASASWPVQRLALAPLASLARLRGVRPTYSWVTWSPRRPTGREPLQPDRSGVACPSATLPTIDRSGTAVSLRVEHARA